MIVKSVLEQAADGDDLSVCFCKYDAGRLARQIRGQS